MKGLWQTRVFTVTMLFGLCGPMFTQGQTGPPKRPFLYEQDANELKDMKDDLAKMQSLLKQMESVFALVGNPTSPANHELELNIDMWRILINQMQRRIDRMEERQAARPTQ